MRRAAGHDDDGGGGSAGDAWWHSPRDLLAVLECDHRLRLEHAATSGVLPRPPAPADGGLDLVAQHGLVHEREALEALRALVARRGGELVEIAAPGLGDDAVLTAGGLTRAALDAQVDVVTELPGSSG